MANQIYNYNPTEYGSSTLSNVFNSSRGAAATDPSLRYLTSSADALSSASARKPFNYDRGASMYQSDQMRYGGVTDIGAAAASGGFPGGRGIGSAAAAPTSASMPMFSQTMPWSGIDPVVAVMKRNNAAFYHQSVLGNHNSIGQNEALFSSTTLAKRPRIETATNLPLYPQRPGEKDCAHYMLTRTCKYGEKCKFDHPIWVPEGGIPDWKEVPLVPVADALPERPGEPDCPYFLKTEKCKFGFKCKFNHPKEKIASLNAHALATIDVSILPERPSEPPCAFYVKTGSCRFGAACKFNHPKGIQIPRPDQEKSNGANTESVVKDVTPATEDAQSVKQFVPFTPALLHNSKGLPLRPGEPDCPFYLKTGSCKYGVSCRYNHPDQNVINPPIAAGLSNAVANLNYINPAGSIFQTIDPRLAQLGVSPTIYPQRPGQLECDFYMKNGECKFGERCKFHHPIDWSAMTPSMPAQQPPLQQQPPMVKLTLAGLPRREGATVCPFYLKTGICKYGANCRFDHPPPGEAIAMAANTQQKQQGGQEEKGEGQES